MEKKMNDFVVNSKGHCFFCLSKILVKSTPPKLKVEMESSSKSSSLHTLQYLSRYLKMDLTKVFQEKGSIPPSLLAKVERSILKVELCEECASLSKAVSLLCRQLEKIKLEIDSKLGKLRGKMLTAEEVGRTEALRRSGEDDGLLEVLKILRLEATEKCASKADDLLSPRVKIQKLTRKEVNAHLIKKKDDRRTSEPIPVTRLPSSNEVKRETQNEDFESDGMEIGNDFDEEGDSQWSMSGSDITKYQQVTGVPTSVASKTEGHSNTIFEETSDDLTVTQSSSHTAAGNYSIDPQTGKYKCSLCSKEFGMNGFYFHYKTVHLKIRYKCNLCEKVFSNKPNYNAHLRSAHLGVRFKCPDCNQQYTEKRSLIKHQQKSSCRASKMQAN